MAQYPAVSRVLIALLVVALAAAGVVWSLTAGSGAPPAPPVGAPGGPVSSDPAPQPGSLQVDPEPEGGQVENAPLSQDVAPAAAAAAEESARPRTPLGPPVGTREQPALAGTLQFHPSMDHTMFDAQVEALSDDYRCIAWDERGFGGTPANGPFSYWDSAADAVALLDHLGIDRAVFAGMSQGGYLSLRAALGHPDRVRGLILMDTQAALEDPEVLEGYRGMLVHWLNTDVPLGEVGELVSGLILGDPELAATWVPIWEARRADFNEHPGNCLLDRDDITDRLGEISAPTLVIHGDADAAIPLEFGQVLADEIPDASIVVMPGGSHAANMTHSAETNAAIADFLAGLG